MRPSSGRRRTAPLAILADLPADYLLVQEAGAVVALRRDAVESLRACGFGPRSDGRAEESALAGRRPLAELAHGEERFLLRRFSHGGLLRWLTGVRFRDPARPFRELLVSEWLRGRGIPTPEVAAARACPAPGFGWRLALVTRRVPEGVDLGALLGRARHGELPRPALRALVRAAGGLVGRLHEAGLLHADLTPANLLAREGPAGAAAAEIWVLDLDRAALRERLTDEERRANLLRLYRYVQRREERHGPVLARSDYARFLCAYDAGPGRWKEDWRWIARAHRRRLGAHRVGWLLERALGRSRDPREGHAG